MKTLTDRTISGLNWNFVANNLLAVINIVVGIILARLLAPQDFGLLGMTYVFLGLAELFVTLGMGSSIQRVKNLTENHIRVATTTTIILGVVVYLLFWVSAVYISNFYNEIRLIPIIRVLSLIFIIQGIVTVSYGQIRRNLDFKYILKIDTLSMLLGYGFISSTLAFLGYGVWSLVYGRIASSIISALLTIIKVPVNLHPLFKKQEFKDLAGFGGGVSLSNLIFYASSNIDLLIVGKSLNSHFLGVYTRALNLMKESLTKVTGGIYNVLFPAFAAVQDNTEKLRTAYLRTIKTVSYFIFPLLSSMIITAEYIIKGLYGNKWSEAITSFQILAVAGILRTTLPYSGALAQATGRVYLEAFQQFVYFLILGASALYAVRFGIEGIAVSIVIASLWLFIAQSWLAIKIAASSWREFFESLIPGVSNMVIMASMNIILFILIEKFFHDMHSELKLVIVFVLNAILLILVIILLPCSIKGDTFSWLLEKYSRIIPSGFVKFYYAFNNQPASQIFYDKEKDVNEKTQKKLTAVLPIKIQSNQKYTDLDRLSDVLLPSFDKFWTEKESLEFLIIVPAAEKNIVEERLKNFTSFKIQYISDEEILPNYNGANNWYKQQVIKLVASKIVQTEFYITLDADLMLVKPTSLGDLFLNGKPVYQQEQVAKHPDWWLASKKVLKSNIMFDLTTVMIGVTPEILYTDLPKNLLIEISLRNSVDDPIKYLLTISETLPWSEYTLYWLYLLEKYKVEDKYVIQNSNFYSGFWVDSDFESSRVKSIRSALNNPTIRFIIIQSTLDLPPKGVAALVFCGSSIIAVPKYYFYSTISILKRLILKSKKHFT